MYMKLHYPMGEKTHMDVSVIKISFLFGISNLEFAGINMYEYLNFCQKLQF